METAILITAGLIFTAAAAAAVVQILRGWSGNESPEVPIEGMYTSEELDQWLRRGIGRFLRDAEIDLSLNEVIGWTAAVCGGSSF
ncbi:MAG UNVERIFIED_CONTAM: hypothetical protein LVR18_51835 [Planctomycetaceae bacterium]|jgi:hypothetical protein